ncbi:MAG: DUF4037 domain-containing protein [Clostridia bacterium]|nr:DUF4037 domain-containing protein [Clostridia bacterium]
MKTRLANARGEYMKGLELSRKFYSEVGEGMLKEQFPEMMPLLAVGLVGSGSECYGFDDEVSLDHDFEPAFCIFVPSSLDRKTIFSLERAYDKLPETFMGFSRQRVSPVGGRRHGVIITEEFFADKVIKGDGRLSLYDWLSVPEYSLYEAVNGEIFLDNLGEVSAIRERLSYYPEDIRLKKLAGRILLAAQAGQYNYGRSISRGDTGAAQLAAIEFAKNIMAAIFLINKTYMPYYKWSFRALRELSMLSDLGDSLEYLISSGNGEGESAKKAALIEDISKKIASALGEEGGFLEPLAYMINDKIGDNNLRNMHILCGV